MPRLEPMASPAHDGGGADLLQPFGQDGIGVDVRQHHESLLNELLRCRKGLDRVGQQIARIGWISSFTHLGRPAAAARRASRTASFAFIAPLVLGRS